MENVRDKPTHLKAENVAAEPKLPSVAQRKLDQANKDLAKLTAEQLDLLYGRNKPKQ